MKELHYALEIMLRMGYICNELTYTLHINKYYVTMCTVKCFIGLWTYLIFKFQSTNERNFIHFCTIQNAILFRKHNTQSNTHNDTHSNTKPQYICSTIYTCNIHQNTQTTSQYVLAQWHTNQRHMQIPLKYTLYYMLKHS
jgi:hypothetical protein